MATDKVELQNDTASKVTVHLHGATVISWVDRGEEVLFCSKQSVFDNKKAIRGGIPLVFPQFGPWSLGPQHGFARIKRWTLESAPQKMNDGTMAASFCLVDDADTRAMWDTRFKLLYTVCLGKDFLNLTLNVTNTGSGSFSFTTLMHTYFGVADISRARISGLQGLKYVDKVHGGDHTEDRAVVNIDENYDRIYENCVGPVQLTPDIEAESSNVKINATNLPDIVVWNPWEEKAKGMSDFGDEEYKTMVCVEAGSVSAPVALEAGSSVSFSQKVVVSQAKNKL